MTAASIYTIKELTAKFGRWAVNSFYYDCLCKSKALSKILQKGTIAPK
jgi:hypothetical protein